MQAFAGDSDLLTVYNAYCAWRRVRSTPGGNESSFCRKNLLSPQTLSNIEDVRLQLLVSIADTGLLNLDQAQKTALNRQVLHDNGKEDEENDANSSAEPGPAADSANFS